MKTAVRAYIELARLSNGPTIVSNVLVGIAIGVAGGGEQLSMQIAVAVSAAILLLYVAGMALNDLADLPIDRVERPTRPLPSGRISVRGARIFVGTCMAVGLGLIALCGRYALYQGLGLVLLIILYNLFHKRSRWIAVLMGLCRGYVYVVAAAAVHWPVNWPLLAIFAGALTLYTLLVTMIAQTESTSEPSKRHRLALFLPLVVLWPLAVIQPEPWTWWPLIAGALLVAWLTRAAILATRQPPRIQPAIMSALAGISLVDAYFLTLLDQPVLGLIAVACFLLTAIGHRYILGT